MSLLEWHPASDLRLLENGEAFFPRVFELIAAAHSELLLETFILAEDRIGLELQQRLIEAARRGVRVELTIDDYGSAELSEAFKNALTEAGVRLRLYDPQPRLLSVRTNLFRRLHRKLVTIDGEILLIGGINYSVEHIYEYGPLSKQDYAMEVRGPVIAEVRRLIAATPAVEPTPPARRWRRRRGSAGRGDDDAASSRPTVAFVQRDNHKHRNDIERAYRLGIRAARGRIVIANAYFFPGYRLLRDLRNAARRGVEVNLILQGKPDMPIVRAATISLHDYLLRAGVRIFEFTERPLHAKVAVIDGEWATVGSSNLDPLSLFLNLEANLIVRDRDFSRELTARLDSLMHERCRELDPAAARNPGWLRQIVSFLAFHLLRHAPRIAGWMPGHGSVPLSGQT